MAEPKIGAYNQPQPGTGEVPLPPPPGVGLWVDFSGDVNDWADEKAARLQAARKFAWNAQIRPPHIVGQPVWEYVPEGEYWAWAVNRFGVDPRDWPAEHKPPAGFLVASNLIDNLQLEPFGVDPESKYVTIPLSTVEGARAYYAKHPDDGVAVMTGPKPQGHSLVAIRARSLEQIAEWYRSTFAVTRYTHVGTDEETADRFDTWEEVESWGSPCVLQWLEPTGPVSRSHATAYHVHNAEEREAADRRRLEEVPKPPRLTTLLWAVRPGPNGELPQFRSRRLADGVELVGDGEIVTYHLDAADGLHVRCIQGALGQPAYETGWAPEAMIAHLTSSWRQRVGEWVQQKLEDRRARRAAQREARALRGIGF